MKHENGTKSLVTLSYLAMVAINAAAVLLPINGVSTKQVSDTYANLFAPAGFTFAVWSIIYFLLGGFVVYQWTRPKKQSILSHQSTMKKIRWLFIGSSILNSLWLVAWQYFYLTASVLIMLGLLGILIYTSWLLTKNKLIIKDKLWVRLPFDVYFGWITVATIANITAFIVEKNITLFNHHQELWTLIILVLGGLIICTTTIKEQSVGYGLVGAWAYFGILKQHQAIDGWNSRYPAIIMVATGVLLVIMISCVWTVYSYINQKKKS